MRRLGGWPIRARGCHAPLDAGFADVAGFAPVWALALYASPGVEFGGDVVREARIVISMPYELARAQSGMLVGVAVSRTFIGALQNAAEALQAQHPKATIDQILDMIFLRGICGIADDYNLPRVDSNPDEDA